MRTKPTDKLQAGDDDASRPMAGEHNPGSTSRGASVKFLVETADEETSGDSYAKRSCSDRCELFRRRVVRCVVCTSYSLLACPIGVLTAIPPIISLLLRSVFCQCLSGASELPVTNSDLTGPKLFFDGAGWAFAFNMGVAKYLLEHFDLQNSPLYAISAGNFAALCILFEKDPELLLRDNFETVLNGMLSRPACGFCDNLSPVAKFLDSWLPDDAHEIASGRLHIAISAWPQLGMRYISKFHDKSELVEVIIASCSMPGFVARPSFSYRRTWFGCWYDAGLQNMITPIDYHMDLPVRAFPIPCCASAASKLPCYCGPSPVDSLGPTGEAIHPGRLVIHSRHFSMSMLTVSSLYYTTALQVMFQLIWKKPLSSCKLVQVSERLEFLFAHESAPWNETNARGHARKDAARYLEENPRPWVQNLINKPTDSGVAVTVEDINIITKATEISPVSEEMSRV